MKEPLALLIELDTVARKVYPYGGLPMYGPNERLEELLQIVKQFQKDASDNHK